MLFPLPDQSDGGPIKVVMIYDTFDAGVRGRKFIHHLERGLGEACGLDCGIWLVFPGRV